MDTQTVAATLPALDDMVLSLKPKCVVDVVCDDRSMSGAVGMSGHQRVGSRSLPKDFSVATPEEFVKRFGGDKVINKVSRSTKTSVSRWQQGESADRDVGIAVAAR